MSKKMISILVNKIKFHEYRTKFGVTKYWYIVGLTNYEMLQLMKVKTPITHPTYYKKEQLEKEISEGKIWTFSAVYIEPSFNPQNLYKILK